MRKSSNCLFILALWMPLAFMLAASDALGANPSITISSPVGGEIWKQDSVHDITWSSIDVSGKIGFTLYRNGVLVPLQYPTYADVSLGKIEWSVPPAFPPGTGYSFKLRSLEDSFVYKNSGFFTITQTGLTAELAMDVMPVKGGTVSDVSGTVATDVPIPINAVPAEGNSFLRWLATPSDNAIFADSTKAQTLLTVLGDVAVYGVFAANGPGEVFTKESKARITLNDNTLQDDKVTITNAAMPLQVADFPQNAKIYFNVGRTSIMIDQNRKVLGNKISYTGATLEGKYTLNIYFTKDGRNHWNLTLTKANINRGMLFNGDGSIPVSLNVAAGILVYSIIGENIAVDESATWKFNIGNIGNSAVQLETDGGEWEDFGISKANGQKNTKSKGKAKFSVTKAAGDPIPDFDINSAAVKIAIDGWEYLISGPAGWKQAGQRYNYLGILNNGGTLQLSLDFNPKRPSWRLNISNAEMEDLVGGIDGIDVKMDINGYANGLRLGVMQRSTLTLRSE